jgi:thymidylate synthase ThyX
MTMNLRNWVHFLKLRLEHGAQYEVRVVAERIAAKLRELWPIPMSVLLPEETPADAS